MFDYYLHWRHFNLRESRPPVLIKYMNRDRQTKFAGSCCTA